MQASMFSQLHCHCCLDGSSACILPPEASRQTFLPRTDPQDFQYPISTLKKTGAQLPLSLWIEMQPQLTNSPWIELKLDVLLNPDHLMLLLTPNKAILAVILTPWALTLLSPSPSWVPSTPWPRMQNVSLLVSRIQKSSEQMVWGIQEIEMYNCEVSLGY